jgi:HEAT repeat protein
MRASLIDLIARMTVREGNTNSDQSVGWHAHREAEALSDASLISELADYVQRESKQDSRKAAYFILGKLGEKFPATECAALLVAQAKKEKNKHVLATLLDALGHISKPTDLDLTPVYALLADERWLVRHSAIQSLKRTNSPRVEEMILHVLETTSDPYDLVYCQATLNEIGSAKAIPFIAKNLKSRKRDVKDSARLAIEAIEAREGRNASR